MSNRCQDCVFWNKPEWASFPERSDCVRFPKVAVQYKDRDGDLQTGWEQPTMGKDEWCGEFRDRWVNGNPPMFRD